MSYRGDAVLGRVRMLDKVTNDSFLRWSSLSANGINFSLGSGPPKVHVASLDLGNFYARIILNSRRPPEPARRDGESRGGADLAHAGAWSPGRYAGGACTNQCANAVPTPTPSPPAASNGRPHRRPRQVRPPRPVRLRFQPTSKSGGSRFRAGKSTTPTTSSGRNYSADLTDDWRQSGHLRH